MRKLTILFVLITLLLQACSTSAGSEPALTLLDLEGNTLKTYSLREIRKMPAVEGYGGYKLSSGEVEQPKYYKGVPLSALAEEIEGFDESMGLILSASDGSDITISYQQLMQGDLVQYDPTGGDQLAESVPFTTILAYEVDGKALDSEENGNFRVMMVSEEPNQAVDGYWVVKFIDRIQLRFLDKDWSLALEGALSEVMDRATFESGAAEKCHGVTWVDPHGQTWTGIPLWLLAGRVDDENVHDEAAFNDALADAGYQIDVQSADGDSLTLESGRIKRNNDIILAYLMVDNALPEAYFPLRLVGAGLEENEMLGKVTKIFLRKEAASASSTESVSLADVMPQLIGAVANPIPLTTAGLDGFTMINQYVEDDLGHHGEFFGFYLNDLVEAAKPNEGATIIRFTDVEGLSGHVYLTELAACEQCMLALNPDGTYNLVMPDLPDAWWLVDVRLIEIQ
jgi:DMSO/TMAO reductase YedYZ molybdopterin-dependent catalytic subunit